MTKQEEKNKSQRKRSVLIALGLFAIAVAFFALTIFKLGGNVASRSL